MERKRSDSIIHLKTLKKSKTGQIYYSTKMKVEGPFDILCMKTKSHW